MKRFLSSVLIFSISLSACAYTKGKTYQLTILHTNDHHGHFWPSRDGEYGLAARATLINQIRSEVAANGGHVLLLDAGDVNTGTPQSDMQDAEPDFRGMAQMGYDVMAIGNHEFDNSLSTIFQQQAWAGFPFISANIYYKKNNERVFPSHVTRELEDLKVTILGLTTEDTPTKSDPRNSVNLSFVPAVEEAKKIVPELRSNTDVLIALTHMGHYANEGEQSDAPGDVALARSVNGIDLIVGGHSATQLDTADIQNGTIIVQAKDWGKFLGRVDLEVLDGKVSLKSYKLIPVNPKGTTERIAADSYVEALLRPFKERGDAGLSQVLGSLDERLLGESTEIRRGETNLGNLVTRAYKEKFNADIGFSNSGGIRSSMAPGVITLESVMLVLPFGNEVGLATFTGAELKAFFEKIIFTYLPGVGGFPQISGVEILANRETKQIEKLLVNGAELDLKREYKMAISRFTAEGGDGYPKLRFTSYGFIDFDLLKEFILLKKDIKASDWAPTGYIKYVP